MNPLSTLFALGMVALTLIALKLAFEVKRLRRAVGPSTPDSRANEELLRTIVEHAPMAILVYGNTGRLSVSNAEARELFFEGHSPAGENFLRLLDRAPEQLKHALLAESDLIFSVEEAGEAHTYSLAKRYFELENGPHTLLMVKHLTPELGRQEIDVWKNVIRIINHELNNSLAPISSMVHSARLISQNPSQLGKLERVFDTIAERTAHLGEFLEGYARFARLPKPRLETVPWTTFLDGIRALHPEVTVREAPHGSGHFDAGQLQQVVINLLKNAREAGSIPAEIELAVAAEPDGAATLSVSDRGAGMSDEALKSALLPFFSTKERGTGLGLALCREIVEAHRGRLWIARREGGGLTVSLWLPGRSSAQIARTGRLTLTRS